MFDSLSGVFLTIVLIGLVPGAVSWCVGYRLIQRLSDPALPELLARHRRQNGVMFGFAMAGVFWVAISADRQVFVFTVAGFFVVYGGLVAAAYPLRRALYQETWSFASYFLFYPRTLIGVFGFWCSVGMMPVLVASAGDRDWVYALPLGLILFAWNRHNADVVRWCLRTQPLPDGDLLTACQTLAAKSGRPDVRFERIPLGGGVIANALALPSLHGSSVLFTETLLERFERREILAVAAHELAHFDHFNPRYLRRLNTGNHLLISAGIAAGPLARAAGSEWGLIPGIVWLLLVIGSLAVRARGKQRQETACDLKAVELTGDADAVIGALTKLYTIARLPRRLANRTEQSATHPSLARRIRDIRNAAGQEPAGLSAAQTLTSVDERSKVIFDTAGLQWLDRDGVVTTLAYSHLTELRIDVRRGSAMRLVAVGPSARRWELELKATDVASVQAVLDRIDGRLADPPSAPNAHAFNPGIKRIVILATVTMALSFGQLGMALIAVLAWAKPTLPMLVGAGLAAMTTAGLMLRSVGDSYLAELWLPVLILALFFFGLAWSARRTPRDGSRTHIAILGVAAIVAIAVVISQGLGVVELHRSARDLPSATVFAVALSGALLCSGERRQQITGLAAALLAVAITFVASTAFLDRFGADPFLVESRPLRWVALDTNPIAVFEVPSNTSRIGMSPSAEYVAVYTDQEAYRDVSGKVQVGHVGDALTPVAADDVSFVNDEKLLVVRTGAQSTALRVQTLGTSPTVLWQHTVEDMLEPSLSVDRQSRRWTLLGWDGDEAIVRVQGTFDGSSFEEKRWPVAQDENGYVSAMTSSGADALVLETRYERRVVARTVPARWTWAQLMLPPKSISRYTTIGDHGRQSSPDSKLDVACVADVAGPGALACTAYDGSRTHIVIIRAGANRVECTGFVDGRFISDHATVEGWLTGWMMGRPLAIHLATGRAFHAPATMRTLRLVPVSGDRIAALTFAANRVKASVFSPLSPSAPPTQPACDSPRRAARR